MIAGVDLAQSLLFSSSDSALVLVANKAALVKVNVTSVDPKEAKPPGSVKVQDSTGRLLKEIALVAPTGDLPRSVPEVPSASTAYTATLPADSVKAGLRLTVSLSNGQSNTLSPRVGGGVAIKLVTVPIQIGNLTGKVVSGMAPYVQARVPVASVTTQSHGAYVSKRVTAIPADSGWGDAFGALLGEISDLHRLENASDEEYYVGFLPKSTLGIMGLGYVPGQATVVADWPENQGAVRKFAMHELGHNFSLGHAPCGTDGDSTYPYPNAQLGMPGRYIWGYLASTSSFVDPRSANAHDIMSYCDGETFSDYNYRLMQVHLTPSDKLVQAASAAAVAPQELLLVGGQIGNGQATLRPLKAMYGKARPPRSGPYTLRIVTAQGSVEYPFVTQSLDHDLKSEHFGFTVPHPGTVLSITIVKGTATLMQTVAKPANVTQSERALAVKPLIQMSEQLGVLQLNWDAVQHPYLTVTWAGDKRSTLAQDLQGGSASLSLRDLPAGGSFEFSLSDGLNSVRVQRSR